MSVDRKLAGGAARKPTRPVTPGRVGEAISPPATNGASWRPSSRASWPGPSSAAFLGLRRPSSARPSWHWRPSSRPSWRAFFARPSSRPLGGLLRRGLLRGAFLAAFFAGFAAFFAAAFFAARGLLRSRLLGAAFATGFAAGLAAATGAGFATGFGAAGLATTFFFAFFRGLAGTEPGAGSGTLIGVGVGAPPWGDSIQPEKAQSTL